MAKQKILRTLLTTVSGLAVMTGIAGDALGAEQTTQNPVENRTSTDAHWNNAATANNDTFVVGDAAHTSIVFDIAGMRNNFNQIDLGGFDNVELNVEQSTSIGSVRNAGDKATIKVGNQRTLTLTGKHTGGGVNLNQYDGVGTINLDANANGATVTVAGAAAGDGGRTKAGFIFTGVGNSFAKSTLNVIQPFTQNAADGSALNFKTINITNAKRLEVSPVRDAGGNAVETNILGAADDAKIDFKGNDSELSLKSEAGAKNAFILQNNFDAGAVGRGKVYLEATGDDGGGNNSSLELKVADENTPRKFGGNAGNNNRFQLLSLKANGADNVLTIGRGVDVTKLENLEIVAGVGNVIAKDKSFAGVKTIAIKNGAKFTLDMTSERNANTVDQELVIPLLAAAGDAIIFENAAATLTLKNAANADDAKDKDVIFTLARDLDPGGAGNIGTLILDNRTTGDGKLILRNADNAPKTLGTAANKLAALQISGSAGKLVVFDVTAGKEISVANVNGNITINKNATLVYGEPANAANGAFQIGVTGDPDVNLNGPGTLILDAAQSNLTVTDPAKFVFNNNDSVLQFGFTSHADAKTVTLKGVNLNAAAAGKGIIRFKQTGDNGSLTLTDNGGNRTLGAGVDVWKEIITEGNVTFAKELAGVGTQTLTVANGSLTVNSSASLNGDHNIGSIVNGNRVAGSLKFELKDSALHAMNADNTKFLHEDSAIHLSRGNVGGDAVSTITLNRSINGNNNGADADSYGRVVIENLQETHDQLHTVRAAGGETLGVAAKRLKELNVKGVDATKPVTINIPVAAATINVESVTATFSQAVTANRDANNQGTMNLNADANVTLAGGDNTAHTIGTVNFANDSASLTVGNGVNAGIELTGKLEYAAAGGLTLAKATIRGNVGAAGAGAGDILFSGANQSTITGPIYLANNSVIKPDNAGTDMKIDSNISGSVSFDDLNATLIFGGTNISGDITSGSVNNNRGNVVFTNTTGEVTVGGDMTRLNSLQIGDAGNTTFRLNNQNESFAERIDLRNDSELVIGENVESLKFASNANGDGIVASAVAVNGSAGTIRFLNNKPVIVEGNLGSTNNGGDRFIKEVVLQNAKVTSRGNIARVKQVTFDPLGNDAIELDIGDANFEDYNFVNNKPSMINTISTSRAAVDITKQFGTAANPIANINLTNANAQTVNIGNNFFGGVTTATNGAGRVNVTVASTNLGSLGSSGFNLSQVDINENATITRGLYSNNVNVAAAKRLDVTGGGLELSQLNLLGEGAHAAISTGTDINFNVRTTVSEQGRFDVSGPMNVNRSIGQAGNGRLDTICFSAGARENVVKFTNASLYGKNVKLATGTYSLASDMTIDGGLQLTGSVLDLDSKKLSVGNGTTTFQGAVTLKSKLSGSNLGQIIANVGADNELRFNEIQSLTLELDDSSVTPAEAQQTYDFITVESGTVIDPNNNLKLFKIVSASNLTNWAVESSGTKIRLVRNNQTGQQLSKSLETLGVDKNVVPQASTEFFSNVAAESDAGRFLASIQALPEKQQAEALTQRVNAGGGRASSDATAAGTSVGVRIASLVAPSISTPDVAAAPTIGVAAGDSAERYGAWFSPFFEGSTQKLNSGTAGYKSESVGGTAGFDVMANDNVIVGAAATYINTDMKHKDFKRGDKTRVESMLGSLYGMWQLGGNYYLQGSTTIGTSKITNSELRRVSATSVKTANGKSTALSFSGELLGGYNYVMDNVVLNPHAGFGISKVNDSSYKESGIEGENLEINKKSSAKVNLILGMRVSTTPYYFNDTAITPEAHAVVRHDLRGDQAKTEVIMDRGVSGANNILSSKAPKTNKTHYNLGVSVNARYSGYDYGVSYDAIAAKKYLAHQGSLKIRVNF